MKCKNAFPILPSVPRDIVTEVEAHRFVTEASSIGLRPGEWPLALTTALGNGRPLRRAAFFKDGSGVRYRQDEGCVVVDVLND